MDVIRYLVWPLVAIVAMFLFHEPIAALIQPDQAQNMEFQVGPGGVTIKRVAASVSSVAATEVKRASQGEGTFDQGSLATNLAAGMDAYLRTASKSARNGRILWVDEKPENNERLAEAFRELGIEVVIAVSNKDAEEKLANDGFSLVISDMDRPPDPEAGLALIDHLRRAEPAIPIIIYAGKWAAAHRGQEAATGAALITDIPSELYAAVLRRLLASG